MGLLRDDSLSHSADSTTPGIAYLGDITVSSGGAESELGGISSAVISGKEVRATMTKYAVVSNVS